MIAHTLPRKSRFDIGRYGNHASGEGIAALIAACASKRPDNIIQLVPLRQPLTGIGLRSS